MGLIKGKSLLKCSIAVLIVFTVGWIILSPYQKVKNKNQITATIRIKKPIAAVFTYLGNSTNAKDWSIYVEEIVPLNDSVVKDGKLKSTRRCYKAEENRTVFWDEEILFYQKNKSRLLSIYNITGFEIGIDNLRTEQLYDSLSANETQLTFTLYPEKESWSDYLKMIIAGYRVQAIFEKNLANIKNSLEKT